MISIGRVFEPPLQGGGHHIFSVISDGKTTVVVDADKSKPNGYITNSRISQLLKWSPQKPTSSNDCVRIILGRIGYSLGSDMFDSSDYDNIQDAVKSETKRLKDAAETKSEKEVSDGF